MSQPRLLVTALLLVACAAPVPGAAAQAIDDRRAVSGADRKARGDLSTEGSSLLLAPPSACPGQGSLGAPAEAQEGAMLCMVNYARQAFGLGPLAEKPELQASAELKSRDVLDCDEFSHYACGREFTHWMGETGYLSQNCWRVGENIAWGRGRLGSVRSIFIAWMRSQTHRENLLGDFAETGIDLTVGNLEGGAGTRVWTQHFGLIRCEPA